jgi:streptogramin lyase
MFTPLASWLLVLALLAGGASARAASRELGDGFTDHGVATPLSQHRGMVATRDGAGRDVMLVWLYDHRGGYALLMIDAETGKAEQFATPYPWSNDGPFASLLSSRGKYYTVFGNHFSEFDPAKRAFTFFQKNAPQMAMSLTEADDGTIWAATYPNTGLVSFNPTTRKFAEVRSANKENWFQYPRSIVTAADGWVYAGVGSAAAQIVAHDPRTGETRALLGTAARAPGYARVFRDRTGRTVAEVPGKDGAKWFELSAGAMKPLASKPAPGAHTFFAGDQGLFHARFPSGNVALECDTIERTLAVRDPKTGETKRVTFEYGGDGAHVIALAAAPDGTITGGTAFPMRMFRFEAQRDAWENWPAHGQFNTVARQGDRFFVGGYGHGFLLEWNPAQTWVHTAKNGETGNPRFLTECEPTINRPHDLLPMTDGHTVVLAGTPGYGLTGGGLLIWDRAGKQRQLLTHEQLLPQQSTMSLVSLSATTFLGGTTTGAGTGGEKKAKEAELYVFDVSAKMIEWHAAIFPDAQTYTDLGPGPRGLIYGFVDRTKFFVFDPVKRAVVYTAELKETFGGVVTGQGPRALIRDERGLTFVLFTKGVARIDDRNFGVSWVAKSPIAISAGGDVLGGRIYFAGGSHVYSYALPE